MQCNMYIYSPLYKQSDLYFEVLINTHLHILPFPVMKSWMIHTELTLIPSQMIEGKFCQCTNYLGCGDNQGKICSGHGNCECNKCNCNRGWSGDTCSCDDAVDNCENPGKTSLCWPLQKEDCNLVFSFWSSADILILLIYSRDERDLLTSWVVPV